MPLPGHIVQKYTEQFKQPKLFACINKQIVPVPVDPEILLRTAEMPLQDDYVISMGSATTAAVGRNWRKPRPRRAGPRRRKTFHPGAAGRRETGVCRTERPG